MKALRAMLVSSRPISWVNTAFPFFAAYLFVTEKIDTPLIIGTLFFLIPYNLLMYGINDVFDYQSDLRNPRKGGIEGALLAPKYHSLVIWVSLSLTVGFSFYLLPLGGEEATMWFVVSIMFVLAYSLPGLRFKEKPYLDSLTSAIHFVSPMLYGLALAGGELVNTNVILITAAFLLWGVGSHAFGAVQDVLADRAAGISSIATEIGARGAVQFAFGAYLLAAIAILPVGMPGSLASLGILPYLLIIAPYLKITDESCEIANRGWRKFIWLNFLFGSIVSLILLNYKQ